MNNTLNFQSLLADLSSARLGAAPLDWPETSPPDLATAYALAQAVREQRINMGEEPVGYKVGFTNRNIWPRYAVFAPIWGTVWKSSLTICDKASPEGTRSGVLSLRGLCEPRIEPEIVLCLRVAPPVACTLEQLAGCVDWVAHGFEIVHTHFPGWKFTAPQTVADAGLHGRLLLGQTVKVPTGLSASDLAAGLSGLRLKLYRAGIFKEEGAGTNVLDGPLQALLHFVNGIRALPGAPLLKAGDLVTTGTLTDAYPVQPGETWHTEIEAAGPVADQLTGLTVRFE